MGKQGYRAGGGASGRGGALGWVGHQEGVGLQGEGDICSPAVRWLSSLARVHVVDTHALLTADVAAPVEDAVAFLFPLLSPGVVASAAAQQVAALYSM